MGLVATKSRTATQRKLRGFQVEMNSGARDRAAIERQGV